MGEVLDLAGVRELVLVARACLRTFSSFTLSCCSCGVIETYAVSGGDVIECGLPASCLLERVGECAWDDATLGA